RDRSGAVNTVSGLRGLFVQRFDPRLELRAGDAHASIVAQRGQLAEGREPGSGAVPCDREALTALSPRRTRSSMRALSSHEIGPHARQSFFFFKRKTAYEIERLAFGERHRVGLRPTRHRHRLPPLDPVRV